DWQAARRGLDVPGGGEVRDFLAAARSALEPYVRRGTAGRHRVHDVDLHHQPGIRGSRGDGRFIEAHRIDRVVRCGAAGTGVATLGARSETLMDAAASAALKVAVRPD